MTCITRAVAAAAAADPYDLIIVGGGIYGATLALESARRGLRPLLIERDDFGGATSWNSLRILHGGLRYLQQADLRRLRESVGERRWFLKHFPDLAEPLACLMPLYGTGLRRRSVMRAALVLNDWLTRGRNHGVRSDRHLPAGRVLDAAETIEAFPAVDRDRLQGGAVWTDAIMPNTPRVIMEILRWAVHAGAFCLNYVEGRTLRVDNGVVVGVNAVDRESAEEVTFRAAALVNCAGPWCREVANAFDRDVPELFEPSLAFNLLLNRPPLSDHALAVSPKRAGARTYFLVPWKHRVFAGTYHTAWSRAIGRPRVDESDIRAMLDDLNDAVEAMKLERTDVLRVQAGLQPAATAGSDVVAVRERLVDHRRSGGPANLYSVSGVKFTTARLVAEKTLAMIYPDSLADLQVRPDRARPPAADWTELGAWNGASRGNQQALRDTLRRATEDEAAIHVDDLLLRRADWAGGSDKAEGAARAVGKLLGWDASRTQQEATRFQRVVREVSGGDTGAPANPQS